MKRLLFSPLVLFSSSIFAATDISQGTGFLFGAQTSPWSQYSPPVVGTSCTDIIGRLNNAFISNNPSATENQLIVSFVRAVSRSTNKTSFNCIVLKGGQTGSGSDYTTITISTGSSVGVPDYSSTSWDVIDSVDCPSYRNFYAQSSSNPPEKLCSTHNGKYCGWNNPKFTNPVVGGSILYKLYQEFPSDSLCRSWVDGTDLITDATRNKLDSLIDRSRDLFADESYTEDSRNNLFDVMDSIVSDYPLTETQALSDIERLEKAISDLKKVDGTDPDPDPDPDPTDPDMSGVIDAINKMSDRLASSISSMSDRLASSISDLSSTIVSSLSSLASSIDSSLNTNFSALFDKIDSSVDSTNLAISEVNSSVLSNGDKLDTLNDSVLSSSDALKTSVDDLKSSNTNGFSDVVSAINGKDLSVDLGDVNVSLDDSNIVSELKSISTKLDDLFSDEGSSDYEKLGTPSDDPRFLSAQSDASSKLATLGGMLGFSSAPPPSDFNVSTGIYGDVTIRLSSWHPLMYIFKLFFQLTVLFYCYKMLSRTVENY